MKNIVCCVILMLNIGVLFANESILSTLSGQYGYTSIPFGLEYKRTIKGTFPENIDPKTAILYSPNAECRLFTDGEGNYLYTIDRKYPSAVKDKPFSKYIYFFSESGAIRYTPERKLIEILDDAFDKDRDPFIVNYIMGFPSSGIGSNFININEILRNDKKHMSIKSENDNIVITLRISDGIYNNYRKYNVYSLILGKIFGNLYPLRSNTRLMFVDENNKETLSPVIFEVLYKNYTRIGDTNSYIPKNIDVFRYKIAPKGSNDFEQKLSEQETIEIIKIISESNEIKNNMKLIIPESTVLFDRENGDMYTFPGVINTLKGSMETK